MRYTIILLLSLLAFFHCSESQNEGNVQDVQTEVWNTILSFWETWASEGNVEELEVFFHENMFTMSPGDSNRVDGRLANLKGYKKFIESTEIIDWELTNQKVQLYGDNQFAVVTFNFIIPFIIEGDTINSTGRDLYVLIREDNKWLIVADHFSSFPKGEE